MESVPVRRGLVDIQLTQAHSHGGCLSIPLFNCTPSAHLIKLLINSIKQVSKLTTQTLGLVCKSEPNPLKHWWEHWVFKGANQVPALV